MKLNRLNTSLRYFDKVRNEKNIIPAIIGAAAAIGSAIYANQKQKQYATDMNQKQFNMNRVLMDQQHLYNVQDWQMENEYNLPYNQMNRLRQAGINPYMALSQMDLGNGSDINGTGMAQVSAPNVPQFPNYFDAVANGISQIYNAYQQKAQVRKTEAEAKSAESDAIINEIQSRYAEEMAIKDLEYKIETNRKAGLETQTLQEQLNDLISTRDERRKGIKAEWNSKVSEYDILEIDKDVKKIELEMNRLHFKALPEKIKLELAILLQEQKNAVLTGQATKAQAAASYASAFHSTMLANGQKITNRVARDTADALIQSAWSDYDMKEERLSNYYLYGTETPTVSYTGSNGNTEYRPTTHRQNQEREKKRKEMIRKNQEKQKHLKGNKYFRW